MSTKETTSGLGFSDYLVRTLPHSVYTAVSVNGELTLSVPASSIKEVLLFLRDHTNCQFKVLIDICGVNYQKRSSF